MKHRQIEFDDLTYWQHIFAQAKANGQRTNFDDLPTYRQWPQPEKSWLRERLAQISQQAERREQ